MQAQIQQPVLQGVVESVAQQQIWKKNNFVEQTKQIPLPKQTEQDIKKIIDKSKQELLDIVAKEKDIMVEKKEVKKQAVDVYLQNTFFNIQNMTVEQYNSFSIIPLISNFVYQRIANLIQIEAEIDPITLDLIQIKGKKIINIVTDLLKQSSTQYKFAKIVSLYESDIDKIQEMTDFIRTIFTKIYDDCVRLDFAISAKTFQNAIWNEKVYKNTTRQFVIQMQNQAFEARKVENSTSKITQYMNEHLNTSFLELLRKKRQEYRKVNRMSFWQKIKPNTLDYTKVIQQQLQVQVDQITSGLSQNKQQKQQQRLQSRIWLAGNGIPKRIRNQGFF